MLIAREHRLPISKMKFFSKTSRCYLRLLLLAALSFLITAGFHGGLAHQVAAATTDKSITLPINRSTGSLSEGEPPERDLRHLESLVAPPLPAAPPLLKGKTTPTQLTQTSTTADSLLQKGIQLYESAQYAAAINDWEQSLQRFAQTSDTLNQALLLSNLSLAHQHLGQWDQATSTITQSLSLLEPLTNASPSPAYFEILGKALNTQGRLHWGQGDMATALSHWREATAAYQQAGYKPGMLKSLINQAKALQALGSHRQSQTILEKEIGQLLQDNDIDPISTAIGLWNVGNAQRQIGELKLSQMNLQESLGIVQQLGQENLQGSILLDLGNTERALSNSALAIGKQDKADIHKDKALQAYQQIVELKSSAQLQAQLNLLSLLIEDQQWSAAAAQLPDLSSTITQLPPSRTAIYAQLNFAKSLAHIMLAADNSQPRAKAELSSPTWQEIDAILVNAVQQAKELKDPIAESFGLGQRGELYESLKQWPQAQALTEQALWIANENQLLDSLYRWEWQQGRLLKEQGQQVEAIKAYNAAVQTLEGVRKNLLFVDADVQFSFRDNVEPVYRELVELLLRNEDPENPNKDVLVQAIQQIDRLQLSELENFLRCDLTQTSPINQFQADSKTAILYPIILEDRLTVILQLPTGKTLIHSKVDRSEVKATLKTLWQSLSFAGDRTPEVIETAQTVYQWMIAPLEEELAKQPDIETLVFVLDGPLRNIPMGVLHDGQQYLLEKYAIAVAPELELFTPRALSDDIQVFTGGFGEPQQIDGKEFIEIEKLEAELDEISQLAGPQPPLINQNFNREALQAQLSTGDFSAIHIKTHGVFSSDPEETFIVAHQELIQGKDLGDLIQTASLEGQTPIELLVLSACSTATGDSRAVLGLAGIAVRAGARSTVSTLWEAQDDPNTKMMIQFYQTLLQKSPGTSRAEALRQAQLKLMKSGHFAPHIWATYVLVGNWL